jgi:hypothetical protein
MFIHSFTSAVTTSTGFAIHSMCGEVGIWRSQGKLLGREDINEQIDTYAVSFSTVGSARVRRTCVGRAHKSELRPCTDHMSFVP